MLNPFKEVQWEPQARDLRSFARSFMIGFPCLGIVFIGIQYGIYREWFFTLGAKIALVGFGAGLLFLVLPVVAKPFYKIWYFLACCIGFVVGNTLMALIYYGMVTPTGFLLRLFGRRAFAKGFNKEAATYWNEASPTPEARRYFKQF